MQTQMNSSTLNLRFFCSTKPNSIVTYMSVGPNKKSLSHSINCYSKRNYSCKGIDINFVVTYKEYLYLRLGIQYLCGIVAVVIDCRRKSKRKIFEYRYLS